METNKSRKKNKGRDAFKNAYTQRSVESILSDIQKQLVTHGAKKIMYEYGDDGNPYSISFIVSFKGVEAPAKLPVKVSAIFEMLRKLKSEEPTKHRNLNASSEHAYKVAWNNILLWIEAQMVMIETEQVDLAEVFMPYLTDRSGETLYEKLQNNTLNLTNGNE